MSSDALAFNDEVHHGIAVTVSIFGLPFESLRFYSSPSRLNFEAGEEIMSAAKRVSRWLPAFLALSAAIFLILAEEELVQLLLNEAHDITVTLSVVLTAVAILDVSCTHLIKIVRTRYDPSAYFRL